MISSLSDSELNQIKSIFFLSSEKKEFSSEAEKEDFFHRWTDYYIKPPIKDLLLTHNKLSQINGYLMGARDSLSALSFYRDKIRSYEIFYDLFELYPAHLHMNVHPEARGLGVGSKLIEEYVQILKSSDCRGVHIVTSPDQRNVGFYKTHGFEYAEVREWKGFKLLFMGRGL